MPAPHLVVNELVPVNKFQFRVRIWRQAGFPPIVLSSQIPGHPPPDWYSSLLGDLVLGSFLGYALPIPVFFELSFLSEKTRAFRVRYETIGNDLRPILHKPMLDKSKNPCDESTARNESHGVMLDGNRCHFGGKKLNRPRTIHREQRSGGRMASSIDHEWFLPGTAPSRKFNLP